MNWRFYWSNWIFGGLFGIILGAFLPWFTIGIPFILSENVYGLQAGGQYTLVLGWIGISALSLVLSQKLSFKLFFFIELLIASASLLFCLYIAGVFNRIVGFASILSTLLAGFGVSSLAGTGIGLYITILGSTFVIIGLIKFQKGGKDNEEEYEIRPAFIGYLLRSYSRLISIIPLKIYGLVFLLIVTFATGSLVVDKLGITARKENREVNETINFSTIKESSDSLPATVSYIKQKGVPGTRKVTIQNIYDKEGNIKETRTISSVITQNPIDQIIVEGTVSSYSSAQDLRQKAQQFYENYKNKNYSKVSNWFKRATAGRELVYSEEKIEKAVSESKFEIKEVTVGMPEITFPYAKTYESKDEIVILASIPIELKSESVFYKEKVTNFKAISYFDFENKDWLFSPIGPVSVTDGTGVNKFTATIGADKQEIEGEIGIPKVFQWIPIEEDSYEKFRLHIYLVINGGFMDGKKISRIEFQDVRDDLGYSHGGYYKADPFYKRGDKDSGIGPNVWVYIETTIGKVIEAKTISIKVTRVFEKPVYSYEDPGIEASPKEFTITGIKIN